MELVVFGVAVFAAIVAVLWRSRRGRTGPDGLSDDVRDKNVGMLGLPNRGQLPGHTTGGQGAGDIGGGQHRP